MAKTKKKAEAVLAVNTDNNPLLFNGKPLKIAK